MWGLDTPFYFYLLLLIPVLIAVYVWNTIWKKKKIAEFGSGNYLKRLVPEASTTSKPLIKMVLLAVTVFALIIALVNPKFGTKIETVKRQGVDIVFAMDVSKSMLAEDLAPSRLGKSKQLASQIINNLASDRIGIVGYAGSAFPMLPITTDYSMAKMYIQDMNTEMVSSMGTALREAIEVGSNYFDDPKTSKVMILISDGEDHGEGISDAVAMAKDRGIKIITIGVGTPDGGQIPIKQNGKIIDYKKDVDGSTVVTKLNDATLKEIAQSTGGVFIYGTKTDEVVDLVDQTLQKIEKTDFESQQIADFQSQFQWFVGLALLLLIIDSLVLERRTAWAKKINLFNEK
ncbi:VWA domain-containing protein [Flavobacterium sp. CBA20B-1]|uniref:vWA domain-containing protein n=1 Tax=unclassified Flavobacterium TaxID=196869 RepID=UPI0022258F2E|nr:MULTISPECIES: VWA domain-containing protein [unclassified Flavobacterium]WCM41345.1 VWA domain-containing protein [Flavobacterium sp. CBA20B-1]